MKRIFDLNIIDTVCNFCNDEKPIYKNVSDIIEDEKKGGTWCNLNQHICKECYDILYEMVDEPKEKMVMTVELPTSARLLLGNKDSLDLIKLLVLGRRNLKK